MIVQDPQTNTEAPLLGKEGVTMMELWKAQMEWLAKTGQLAPIPQDEDATKKSETEPTNT
jgi:hypothetical protein